MCEQEPLLSARFAPRPHPRFLPLPPTPCRPDPPPTDDVNPANGHTLLHKVAEAGHADVAAALLSHGGLRLLGARDHSGRTALDVAAPEAKTALEAAAQQLRGCVERGLGEEGETAQEGRAER